MTHKISSNKGLKELRHTTSGIKNTPPPKPIGLTLRISVRDLECVKNAVRIINNCIYKQGGVVSEYNMELLEALLSESWEREYCLGKCYIEKD